jgi:DNA-binding MarR family transcriptional regulator
MTPQTEAFNELIHQPLRLRIMAALAQVRADSQMKLSFTRLRDLTGASDGNLGAHIAALEKATYITVEKLQNGSRPVSVLSLTDAGRAAFAEHAAVLRRMLDQAQAATPH